jgi:hypothetical protein
MECLEKRLKAAVDRATEHGTVDLDLAHTRGSFDLPRRRGADEGDFDSLRRGLFGHEQQARQQPA